MALPRTLEMLDLLGDAVASCHGDLTSACKELGVSVVQVTQWLRDDTEAAEKIGLAKMIGYAAIETEARRRAIEGIEEAVWYQGEVVGTEVKYSDSLLSQMLKARVPGYGGNEGSGGGVQVNVAIMPRADSYEEWIVMRDAALKPPEQIEHKPVEEAEFVEVPKSLLRDVL